MISRSVKLFLFITLFLTALGSAPLGRAPHLFAQTNSDGTIIHLDVYNCNDNGMCEPQFGENYQGCPLDCTAPTSTPPSTGGGGRPPSGNHNQTQTGIYNVRVTIDQNLNAIIRWSTYQIAGGSLSWGRTPDTRDGTIAEINFWTEHAVQLSHLLPNTFYYFIIQSTDINGVSSVSDIYSFLTPNIFITTPNIINIEPQIINNAPYSIQSSTTPSSTISGPLGHGGVREESYSTKCYFWFCEWWWIYLYDYFVAYLFGFLNYLGWLFIHI